MPNLDTLVNQAEEVVQNLEEKLNQIEEIHRDILRLIEKSKDLPAIYDERYKELHNLSEKYITQFNESVNSYISDNNKLILDRLKEFAANIEKLQKEIDRLINVDFSKLFADLQKEFIQQTKEDLQIEYKKIDERITALQNKTDALQTIIDRLEKIDLKKGFDDLQKTLSDIFGAINAINLTLTSVVPLLSQIQNKVGEIYGDIKGISQTLSSIVQLLGTIQIELANGFNNTNQNINTSATKIIDETAERINLKSAQLEQHLLDQDSKIKLISEQNELLKKEIKTNRIIQIVGIVATIGILVYVAFIK